MTMSERARLFATAAHAAVDQRRKYVHTPYIEHPEAVAAMVALYGGDEGMIAAAWLHDVVEDTSVTLALVRQEFGDDVAGLVEALTDAQTPADGNRAIRKRRAAETLAVAGGRAQTIKYADLIHNVGTIVEHDPGFARVYLREKRELLDMMRDGDPGLRAYAYGILRDAERRLAGAMEEKTQP